MNSNHTIALGGHFTVGEQLTALQRETMSLAAATGHDLGIIVNDIDLKRRLQFYRIGGQAMVVKQYGNRKKCGTTKTLCELPDFSKIPGLIDWQWYDAALVLIERSDKDIDTVIREEIVPAAVEKRITEYGLQPDTIRVWTERELRNYAGTRLSTTRQQTRSWRSQLEQLNLLEDIETPIGRIPVCGAIFLSFYEKLHCAGYHTIKQFFSPEDRVPVENADRIYRALHEAFPDDPRWSLIIRTEIVDFSVL